jgi:hypothetical protein
MIKYKLFKENTKVKFDNLFYLLGIKNISQIYKHNFSVYNRCKSHIPLGENLFDEQLKMIKRSTHDNRLISIYNDYKEVLKPTIIEDKKVWNMDISMLNYLFKFYCATFGIEIYDISKNKVYDWIKTRQWFSDWSSEVLESNLYTRTSCMPLNAKWNGNIKFCDITSLTNFICRIPLQKDEDELFSFHLLFSISISENIIVIVPSHQINEIVSTSDIELIKVESIIIDILSLVASSLNYILVLETSKDRLSYLGLSKLWKERMYNTIVNYPSHNDQDSTFIFNYDQESMHKLLQFGRFRGMLPMLGVLRNNDIVNRRMVSERFIYLALSYSSRKELLNFVISYK